MKTRCKHPTHGSYKNYGGRGIKVCERWLKSFEAFLEDMGRKPSPAHSLERKDRNGDYEPGNVVWAMPTEQMRNTSKTVKIEYQGQTYCMKDFCAALNLNQDKFRFHYRRSGKPLEQAIALSHKKHVDVSTEDSFP
jgi:hypothetical protein